MDKPMSLFDSRIVERNIAAGVVTREEYEAMLASLEDCADMAVETETRFIRHESTDEDDKD